MARFLATAYIHALVTPQISVEHQDNTGNPDFLLEFNGNRIGVECVEVVPQEWYAVEAMRNREHPESMTFLHRFQPKDHLYTNSQKISIADGSSYGEPWVGNAPEAEWADAHAFFIEDKVKKLRKGNYQPEERLWLLMQDEWRVPVTTVEQKILALSMLLPKLPHLLAKPSFERIFICSSSIMFEVSAVAWNVYPLENWWQ
jgi:hypothetical protein